MHHHHYQPSLDRFNFFDSIACVLVITQIRIGRRTQ
jgi:hypothetical protein